MYKKIDHHIVEHHYNVPAKISLDAIQATDGYPIVFPALPTEVINEYTMTFRMDSRTLWTRYSLSMVNYSVSSFADLSSTPNVERNLSRNAAAIGSYFVPYYGITAGTKIGDLLDVIVKNGVKVVEAIKAGTQDLSTFQSIWAEQTYALAEYLNKLNPSQYPTDLINEMLTNLTKFWVDDFNARLSKDFAAVDIAQDNILKVAVSGVPDHITNKGYSSLADILSRGVIAQFPNLFMA